MGLSGKVVHAPLRLPVRHVLLPCVRRGSAIMMQGSAQQLTAWHSSAWLITTVK
jgi:hypothetical protein